MSRKLKNILMIVLLVILIITNGLTVYFSSRSNSNLNNNQNLMEQPPSMKQNEDSNSTSKDDTSNDGFNQQFSNENKENNSQNNTQSDGTTNNQPPEKPSGEDDKTFPNQNGESAPEINSPNSTNISNTYFILFVIQSLAITLIIMYLLMFKFNKKTLKETFISSDKIIIYGLSTIIITSSLTYLDNYVAKNMLISSSNSNNSTLNNNVTYSSTKEITENTKLNSGKYISIKGDENVILASGDISATLKNISVSKTGDSSSGDDTSFYGINSAIIAKSGANLQLENLDIVTNATGANGVFSYGGNATTNNNSNDGTVVTISNSTIKTKKDNSGGIMTTGGGITKAYNLTINTSGISSAAIRTDRGGGTVTVDGGTYTTTGNGSPFVYSTANVKVKNATLKSNTSEGIVVEGKNSVTLEECTLTSNNTELNGLSTTYKNIFLYQSMSGDASNGNSTFTAKDSNITTSKGDTFYVTNTTATISLNNNTIKNNDSTGNFLRIQKDSWGKSGDNGGEVKLNLTSQQVEGNIVVDELSTLSITLENNSSYEGIISAENKAKSISLKLDKNSHIKLTGNSYIISLSNEASDNSNIDFNGYKLYVDGTAIN